MEVFYQNHGVAPAATSWFYQPRCFWLPNDPLNHIGPVQYGQCSFLYGSMPVFLHPGVSMTNLSYIPDAVSAVNLLPYGSQNRYIWQPMSYRNLTWFLLYMPVPFLVVHSPEMFYGNSLCVGCGDCRYGEYQPNIHNRRAYFHNGWQHFTEPCFFHSSPANAYFSAFSQDGYLYSVYMSGWDWTRINGTANLHQPSHFPVVNGSLQQNFYPPDDEILSDVANGYETYTNEDPCIGYGGGFASQKPFGFGQAVSPSKEKSRSCQRGLPYISEIPNEQSSSQQLHGSKNSVETDPTKSLVISSTSRALGKTSSGKKSDQQGESSEPTQPINPALHSERGKKKASAPRQVWQEKTTKPQPSASQTKRSTKHDTNAIYHITWDGFDDEPSEPIRQECPLCEENLSVAPTDDEDDYYDVLDEPSHLPDVSVLPCGHAFHSLCLQFLTPEEQFVDPLCFVCLSIKS